jgi:hypothetical protein
MRHKQETGKQGASKKQAHRGNPVGLQTFCGLYEQCGKTS